MFYSVLVTAALAVNAAATPFNTHVVHERRHGPAHGWTKRSRLQENAILPMRVGLKQSNLDRGYEYINDVSHPTSPNFGKHWSAKQIAEAFAPSEETVKAVKTWLAEAGFDDARVKLSQGLNWLEFNATVPQAEDLLKTRYNVYEHKSNGQPHVACESYSLPAHVQPHVDFITPTVHFDAKVEPVKSKRQLRKRQSAQANKPARVVKPGSWTGWLPKLGRMLPSRKSIIKELENCDEQIVPDCLRALYSFPQNTSANSENSYGIVEYTPEAYVPSDLDLFFANFSPAQVGDRPNPTDLIDGAVNQQTNKSFDFNGESDLDLEYALTLVYPQPVTLYQVGDLVEGASFNTFLDAIDGSYCTFEGGDDPTQDPTYPDTLPGGYTGPENCGGFAATKVISTSYGYNEADLTPFYEQRQCAEYMKLGLAGTTILYSSGDYGVAGNGNECIASNGSFINGDLGGTFNPSFPGTCPYVTSVGATQVKNNTNILTDLASGTEPEQACETVIFSGGGFSNVFPLPDYQADAVNSYLTNYPPPYGADKYNNSGTVRAIPDVSANGANYVIAIDGEFGLVYGTSASSPTFGSVITLINGQRFDAGKSSVGFLNPTLYANSSVLNDITEGDNPGCATSGFQAQPGWDPVTGLGTPNYPKLLELFLSLP
ncbi:subtilisin-like protein [Viridothelium virens]|uniref:tripeptidyl-peptidase II n=1 Tax=Viridothelium virens TaxID=1048519 RepID=A0A6A6H357_VIRVR|nr:subtilisin-like protein [Viridothelium virens]